jgi:hypothetical protein
MIPLHYGIILPDLKEKNHIDWTNDFIRFHNVFQLFNKSFHFTSLVILFLWLFKDLLPTQEYWR